MAKTKISQYDATAANNTDIDSISIAEGMAPSNVNNSIRAILSHLKKMDVGTDALTSPQLTSVDINGGSIDGAVIGANSAAAITGTTLALSGNADLNGDLDVDGTTNLDVVDIDGLLTASAAIEINGAAGAGISEGMLIDWSTNLARFLTYDSSSGSEIAFFTQPSGGSTAERVRIKDDGGFVVTPVAGGHAVFNEGSIDADFRVESNGNANMLFVDGGNNRVGIGTNIPSANAEIYDTQNTQLRVNTESDGYLDLSNYGNGGAVMTSAAHPLRLGTANTERMRIDGSSGNVGIGTSVPSNKLIVKRDATTTVANSQIVNENRTGASGQYALYATSLDNGSGSGFKPVAFGAVQTAASGRTADFIVAVSDTDNIDLSADERMRIDSSGNLLVGTTNNVLSSRAFFESAGSTHVIGARVGANGHYALGAINAAGTVVGGVVVNASSTTYATSSDYRLKENVDYTWDATTRLKQLKPARFNFITDDTNTLIDGFLAHEVSSIVPEAIIGTKDAVDGDGNPDYQGIDQSKLVPLLVKTIQELEARITALEG